MKRKIINIFVIISMFILGITVGLNVYNPYDVNKDKKITAQDYVEIRNYIMNKESDKDD